ncbi:MAG: hypothetical protein PUF01_02380 [Eubacteriales bacterium]|nr:hypothetical protein [Eubacteriales bacterium]
MSKSFLVTKTFATEILPAGIVKGGGSASGQSFGNPEPETECHFETVGELLNYRLDSNDCIRDIITQAEVVWRNI